MAAINCGLPIISIISGFLANLFSLRAAVVDEGVRGVLLRGQCAYVRLPRGSSRCYVRAHAHKTIYGCQGPNPAIPAQRIAAGSRKPRG